MEQRKIRLYGKKLYFIVFQICVTVFNRGRGEGYLTQADDINSHRLTKGKEGAQTVLAIMHLKFPFLNKIVKFISKLVRQFQVKRCVQSLFMCSVHKYKDQLILF